MKKLLILAVALLGIIAAFTSCAKSSDPLAGTSWRANLDYNEVITLQIGANMTGTGYVQDMEDYGEVEETFTFTYTYSDASKTAGTLFLTPQGYYGSITVLATFTIANNMLYVTGNFFGYGASTTIAFNKI